MAVIGKFYVSNIEPNEYVEGAAVVRLGAVCRGSQNKSWAAATPSGHIEMTILNSKATEQFVLHDEYEVVFRRVAKPEPGDGHEPQPDYPPYDTEKKYPQCGFCGVYPVHQEDGSLDWSSHEELYGKKD